MKIAMFTDAYFPRINGVSVSVKSFATELSRIGHEVCVVCLEYSQEQQRSSFFNEKENRYEVVNSFVNQFESEDISSDNVDYSFVTNYSDDITEERKNMIENKIDDGILFEIMPTIEVSRNEDGRYTAIFSLNILSAYVNSGV